MAINCPKCQYENPDETIFCGKCATPLKPSEEISISHTKTIRKPSGELSTGSIFSGRYKIIEELGKGGMGIVYKAEDKKLKRSVALKFLPPELTSEPEAKARFIREAQAAAALSHPNICTIHEIDEEERKSFIVMEYVKGLSLKEKIKSSPLQLEEVLDIAIQAAEGLEEAHKKGIVHRDIKSGNIMVTEKGQAKIMDFGLAKVAGESLITKEARTMGTAAYMSPQQAQGEPVDQRTDIWSLGVVLYEMLCGEMPFRGERETSVLYSIVHEEPISLKDAKSDIPLPLQKIVYRALKKNPESRFTSAAEMAKDLKEYQRSLRAIGEVTDVRSFLQYIKRPNIAIPAIIVILLMGFFATRFFIQNAKINWARNQAIPEMIRLAKEEKYQAAFQLATQAEKIIPEDTQLISLWPDISAKFTFLSKPPGADVYRLIIPEGKTLNEMDLVEIESGWSYIGQTPIKNARIPLGYCRWKAEKEGYETTQHAVEILGDGGLKSFLVEKGSLPPGMVPILGFALKLRMAGIGELGRVELKNFYIDKYEVTNREFKEFVDAGGYERREFWKHEFRKDEKILNWEEATAQFKDTTGRPGPATWELGIYPEGKENYPVSGVSWYEAAAYAEFAGKCLPTVYHWIVASGVSFEGSPSMIPLSNFSGKGPSPVGKYQGISMFGTYDMAGNIREWCWNRTGEKDRYYILGGAWSDPIYLFTSAFTSSSFDRSVTNGFRCAKHISPEKLSAKITEPIVLEWNADYKDVEPVSDEIFQIYKRFYSYDKKELDPVIESTDDSSEYWRKEKITHYAGYSNERMIARLLLPKSSNPPYQTVVFFPGAGAFYQPSSDPGWLPAFEFIIRSGRAVLYPIHKSFHERMDGFNQDPPSFTVNAFRDRIIIWSKEFCRSIDYLETRDDIDSEKLAFYGVSLGGTMGPLLLALEDRIKVCVLRSGGLSPVAGLPPEVNTLNFAPRVTIPTLMINGRYDHFFPFETLQKPLFHFLGTPEVHKRHLVLNCDHIGMPRITVIKETLDWLDRYLGPVKRRGATAHEMP